MTFGQRRIRRVAVLGAGVMGAQIAAHFANAGLPVSLYELASDEGDGNANVNKALDYIQSKGVRLVSIGAEQEHRAGVLDRHQMVASATDALQRVAPIRGCAGLSIAVDHVVEAGKVEEHDVRV